MYWQGKYDSNDSDVSASVEPVKEKISVVVPTGKGGKLRKRVLFLLLLAVNGVVMLTVYDFCVAEQGTPFMKTIESNYVYKLYIDKYGNRKERGKVSMIICDVKEPMAIIDGKKVKAGDMINNVQIVKIGKADVEFKKGSQTWKQRVGDPADSSW